ncbi:MAG: DUF5689 domain-containing protein [Bacteroidales bacterium]|nr:DUF5689 domain-containing protein [Bacteroidales bacterium]
MKKNRLQYIILLVIVALFAVSCKKDLDVAPCSTYDGKATHTIAELLAFHNPQSGNAYDSIPQGVVIQGVVVSSDKEGNCYKYLTLDDGTSGIQIKLNSSTLYTNYPIGQRVFVKCDGLVLGNYGYLHQLGWYENGQMQALNTNVFYKYLYKDGMPGPEPEPIVLHSKNDVNPTMYSRLVRFVNCTFENPGNTYGGNQNIVLESGDKLILYTSDYATFANQPLPEGKFDIVGILATYYDKLELIIRSLDDVKMHPTYTEEVLFAMHPESNPLENGWTVTGTGNVNWTYNATKQFVQVTGVIGVAANAWLISPAIGNTTAYDNFSVKLSHASKQTITNRKVYYSTTYNGGSINESDWIEIPNVTFSADMSVSTLNIPADAIANPNLRFAFRYFDNVQSQWQISDFQIVINKLQ